MKRILSSLLSLCLLLLLSACGENEIREYTIPDKMGSVASGIVAENNRYTLEWDDETKCVILKDRQSGHVWSTTPYDYYLTEDTSYSLSSPLVIDYYDKTDGSVQTVKAFECVEDELVSAGIDGNNLRVTFYFRDAEITITLTYTLRDDSLQISLNTSDIEESGKTNLISVSVAPYLCSVANTEPFAEGNRQSSIVNHQSSYLFIPSGSGALMYTDEENTDMSREFSGEVYGYDPSRTQLDHPGEEAPVRLPVFGVKAGENALFAIIEKGDGAARVDAAAGNPRNGYCSVYATFYVRGYNNTEWDTRTNASGNRLYKDVILLSKKWPENREFTVGYYPLSGEDANYSGMAARYRNYLQGMGGLEKSGLAQQPYHVTMIGGAEVQKFTLGVPHNAFLSLTTFDQAQMMLKELKVSTGQTPEVLLKGFGNSGLDVGQIAGGFTFSSAAGGQNGHKSLEAFCQSAGIPLFTDFDLVRFTRSGNGFSPMFNTARAADSQAVAYFPLKRNVRAEDTEKTTIRFLQRSMLETAAEKLAVFGKNRISGIGLSVLGNTAYSDYREEQYALKGSISEQTRTILKNLKDAGHPVTLSAANAYAAGLGGSISYVPLQNGGYDALDETVPFYEMVFRGTIPLYSTALNLSQNPEKELLRCIEAGVSPTFELSYSFDKLLADSSDSLYYGILYDSNKAAILDMVKRTADLFKKIENAEIKSHKIFENGVTQTAFDNGITVIVNHNDGVFTIKD